MMGGRGSKAASVEDCNRPDLEGSLLFLLCTPPNVYPLLLYEESSNVLAKFVVVDSSICQRT